MKLWDTTDRRITTTRITTRITIRTTTRITTHTTTRITIRITGRRITGADIIRNAL